MPRADAYASVETLQGKNIATSYPNILGRYLAEHGVQANLHTISGSV